MRLTPHLRRRQEAPPRLYACAFYYPGGDILRKKLKRLLLSERGDSSYISSFIYILVAVVLIAFIINVFHIISTKQEMDHIADQLVKQIQLNGFWKFNLVPINVRSQGAGVSEHYWK